MECRAELLADCDVFLVRQSKLVGTLRWPVASTTVRLCLLLSSSWSLNTLSSLSLTELCPESFVMLELFRNKGCLGFVWTLTLSKDLEDTLKFSLSLSWFRRSVCPFVPFGNVDLESLWSSRLCSMKSSWSESMWHFRKEPSSWWTWMVAMIVKQLVKQCKLLIHSQYIVRAEKSSLTIVCWKLNPNKILVR